MWFLLVTTITSAVLADAGYLYNQPEVPFSFPHNQPVSTRPIHYQPHGANVVHGIQDGDKSILYSISYKDYVYLKKDNDNNYNSNVQQFNPSYNHQQVHGQAGHAEVNGRILTSHNVQTNAGYTQNGYAGYSQHFTPTTDYNNDLRQSYLLPAQPAQSHHHHDATPISNVGSHVSYNHGSPQATNTGYEAQDNYYHTTSGYDNNYVEPSPVRTNQNSGYSQTFTAPDDNNYYSYSQPSAPPAPVAHFNNLQRPNLIPSGGNNGYVQSAAATGVYNNRNPQVITPEAGVSVTHSFNQGSHINPIFNNRYQVPTALPGADINSDYSQSFTSPSNFDSHSGYSQTIQNTGITQTSAPSVSLNFNNGNDHASTSTDTASLNTGYGVPTASTNGNNLFAPSPTTTTSDISSSTQLQASTGPIHIDLNADISQSLPLSNSALDDSATQSLTSGSENLYDGLSQGNSNSAINPTASVPNTPPVTPIIHKHIYFHVPPPEIEEPERVLPPPPPPKKNYKILFIKVPSQESKSNIARLQQEIAQRQNAAIEDKTLIYVLVKNPADPKPVVLPKHKPSEHEVIFVKYNGNPFDIASQVNDELDKTGLVKSIVPLQPGLVNGQHK